MKGLIIIALRSLESTLQDAVIEGCANGGCGRVGCTDPSFLQLQNQPHETQVCQLPSCLSPSHFPPFLSLFSRSSSSSLQPATPLAEPRGPSMLWMCGVVVLCWWNPGRSSFMARTRFASFCSDFLGHSCAFFHHILEKHRHRPL